MRSIVVDRNVVPFEIYPGFIKIILFLHTLNGQIMNILFSGLLYFGGIFKSKTGAPVLGRPFFYELYSSGSDKSRLG